MLESPMKLHGGVCALSSRVQLTSLDVRGVGRMVTAQLCRARYKIILSAAAATATAVSATLLTSNATTAAHGSKEQCQKRQATIIQTSLPKRSDMLAPLFSRVMLTARSEEGRAEEPKKRSVDDFIGSLFSNKRSFLPDLSPVDKIQARVAESFSSQIDSLQKSFDRFWEMLNMEDFRKLVDETVEEYKNAQLHPEIQRDAHVRQGSELSQGELEFLEKRRSRQIKAFADFIGVDVSQVDERDIPVIGVAASGGGYRAMIGCAGYLKAIESSGVMDTVTYIASVSGSCWTMAQYYSPLSNGSYDVLLDHLKSHIHTHLANVTNFVAVLNASHENAKLLMQGMIERYYQLDGTVNLVDVFGMLLGGTLLTKKETISQGSSEAGEKEAYSEKISDVKVKSEDDASAIREQGGEKVKPKLLSRGSMALSAQAQYVMDGSRPYPIYCVVRHDTEEKSKDQEQIYQWFEFTPHEMGSEEINAWIPVWAFGRKFENGKNTERLPEQALSIMMGTFGSAFAASLAHFYNEMRSFVPAAALDKTDEMITRYRDSMSAYHPISGACFPNPFYRLDTPSDAKDIPGIERFLNSKQLCVADAGLDNNLPFYPLLRRGRNVDIILAIDLSADIQTAPHFDRAEGYARRRGIGGWPIGAGWPKEKSEIEAKANARRSAKKYPLGTCTIFDSTASQITLTQSTHQPSHVNPITVVYFPLIVNENYDPDFDPQTADFCSTWNFVYSTSQVSKLTGLAAANWNDNIDKVRHVLRKAWERKRSERISKEIEANQREIISTA